MKIFTIYIFIGFSEPWKQTDANIVNVSTEDSYQCFDGSHIPMEYFCDGVGDCSDGSDERECAHVPSLSVNLPLHGLYTSITSLSIEYHKWFTNCLSLAALEMECISRHDIYGMFYDYGQRSIARDGDPCLTPCRTRRGVGIVCETLKGIFQYCHVPYCNKNGGIDHNCDFTSSFCEWKVRSNATLITYVDEDLQEGVIEMSGRGLSYLVLSHPVMILPGTLTFTLNITIRGNTSTYWTYFAGDNKYSEMILEKFGWTNTICNSCAFSKTYPFTIQIFLYFFAYDSEDFSIRLTFRRVAVNPVAQFGDSFWQFHPALVATYYCSMSEYPCEFNGRCIPISYTLDDFPDCPFGDDATGLRVPYEGCRVDAIECKYSDTCVPVNSSDTLKQQCLEGRKWPFDASDTPCPGSLQCRGNVTHPLCLDQNKVCDGIPNCPHRDDEINCHASCPSDCMQCLDGVFECLPSAWDNIPQVAYSIDLSGHRLNISKLCSLRRPLLTILKLSKCELETLGCLSSRYDNIQYLFPRLKVMDLSCNYLKNVDYQGEYTHQIDLSENSFISSFKFEIFNDMFLRRALIQDFYVECQFSFAIFHFNTGDVRNCSDVYMYCDTLLAGKIDFSQNKIKAFRLNCIEPSILNMSYNELTYITYKQFPFPNSLITSELYLQNNRITHFPALFQFLNLRILDLRDNKIETFEEGTLQVFRSLRILLIRHNMLNKVNHTLFYGLFNLEILDLGHNEIQLLPRDIFEYLINLKVLDLNGNKLTYISKEVFDNLIALLHLDLRGNSIDVQPDMFGGLSVLQRIFVPDSTLCCALPIRGSIEICFVQIKTLSSCQYLLNEGFLSVSVWFLSIAIITVSIYSARRLGQNICLCSMLFAGILSGTYLLVVSFTDVKSKGIYGYHHNSWIFSEWCAIARVLALLSVEGSTLFYLLAYFDGYFEHNQRSRFYKNWRRIVLVVMMWTALIAACVIRVYYNQKSSGESRFELGVCTPFFAVPNTISSSTKLDGVDPYTMINVGVLLVISGIIILFEVTRILCWKDHGTGFFVLRNNIIHLIVSFFMLARNTTIAVFECLPFWGVHVSIDLYTWLSVFVCPLTSLMIPILMLRLRKGDDLCVKEVLPPVVPLCHDSDFKKDFGSLIIVTDSIVKQGITIVFKDEYGWKKEAKNVRTLRNLVLCDAPVYYRDGEMAEDTCIQICTRDMDREYEAYRITVKPDNGVIDTTP